MIHPPDLPRSAGDSLVLLNEQQAVQLDTLFAPPLEGSYCTGFRAETTITSPQWGQARLTVGNSSSSHNTYSNGIAIPETHELSFVDISIERAFGFDPEPYYFKWDSHNADSSADLCLLAVGDILADTRSPQDDVTWVKSVLSTLGCSRERRRMAVQKLLASVPLNFSGTAKITENATDDTYYNNGARLHREERTVYLPHWENVNETHRILYFTTQDGTKYSFRADDTESCKFTAYTLGHDEAALKATDIPPEWFDKLFADMLREIEAAEAEGRMFAT